MDLPPSFNVVDGERHQDFLNFIVNTASDVGTGSLADWLYARHYCGYAADTMIETESFRDH